MVFQRLFAEACCQVYNASKQYAPELRVCSQASKLPELYVNVHIVHYV